MVIRSAACVGAKQAGAMIEKDLFVQWRVVVEVAGQNQAVPRLLGATCVPDDGERASRLLPVIRPPVQLLVACIDDGGDARSTVRLQGKPVSSYETGLMLGEDDGGKHPLSPCEGIVPSDAD